MANMNTVMHICSNVPIDRNGNHQIYMFDTEPQQYDFFYGYSIHREGDRGFVKVVDKDHIMVSAPYSKIQNANYVMLTNTGYGNKTVYAFITQVEYNSEDSCKVYIEIDPFQTYYFGIRNGLHHGYVIREHQYRWNADGTPKININEEDVGSAELKLKRTIDANNIGLQGISWFVFQSTKPLIKGSSKPIVGGLVSTTYFTLIPVRKTGSNASLNIKPSHKALRPDELVDIVASDSSIHGSIVSLTVQDYVPVKGVSIDGYWIDPGTLGVAEVDVSGETKAALVITDKTKFESEAKTIAKSKKWARLDHSESKIMMPPYTRAFLQAPNGEEFEFDLSRVDSDDIEIKLMGSFGSTGLSFPYINNYNGHGSQPWRSGIMLNIDKSMPWIDNYQTAYVQANSTQKYTNIGMSALSGGIAGAAGGSIVPGLGTVAGAAVGAAVSLASSVAGEFASKMDRENLPNVAKGGSGNVMFDIMYGLDRYKVNIYQPVDQDVEMLTEYFEKFGYKTLKNKRPNVWTRRYWNYVEVKQVVIREHIPAKYKDQIVAMFERGITLWHTSDVGNYSLNNFEI